MASKMYQRALVTLDSTQADESQNPIINHRNLLDFQDDTINNVNDLIDFTNNLYHRVNAVEELIKFAGWAQTIYPHLAQEYKTSERVAARLTDDDVPKEMCEVSA